MQKFIEIGVKSLNPKIVNVSHIVEVEKCIAGPYSVGGVTTYSFFYKTVAGNSFCKYLSETEAIEGLADLHEEMRRVDGYMC